MSYDWSIDFNFSCKIDPKHYEPLKQKIMGIYGLYWQKIPTQFEKFDNPFNFTEDGLKFEFDNLLSQHEDFAYQFAFLNANITNWVQNEKVPVGINGKDHKDLNEPKSKNQFKASEMQNSSLNRNIFKFYNDVLKVISDTESNLEYSHFHNIQINYLDDSVETFEYSIQYNKDDEFPLVNLISCSYEKGSKEISETPISQKHSSEINHRWKIFSQDGVGIVKEIGCEISIDEVIKATVSGLSWEEYIGDNWRDMGGQGVSDWNCYGPTTFIDKCIQFKGDEDGDIDCIEKEDIIKELDVNLEEFYPDETDLSNNLGENHFFLYAYGFEKGYWDYKAFEISENFNPKFIKPIFKENSSKGIVSHYLYEDKNLDANIEIYGDLIESRSAVGGHTALYVSTNEGPNEIYLDDIRSKMGEQNLDSTNKEDVRNHLINHYNIKE
tara:strand:- start:1465 stop:2781 length:1317 start_codon:yes stop_codon:yes gene_type:complete